MDENTKLEGRHGYEGERRGPGLSSCPFRGFVVSCFRDQGTGMAYGLLGDRRESTYPRDDRGHTGWTRQRGSVGGRSEYQPDAPARVRRRSVRIPARRASEGPSAVRPSAHARGLGDRPTLAGASGWYPTGRPSLARRAGGAVFIPSFSGAFPPTCHLTISPNAEPHASQIDRRQREGTNSNDQLIWAVMVCSRPSRTERRWISRRWLGAAFAMIQARFPCCWVK